MHRQGKSIHQKQTICFSHVLAAKMLSAFGTKQDGMISITFPPHFFLKNIYTFPFSFFLPSMQQSKLNQVRRLSTLWRRKRNHSKSAHFLLPKRMSAPILLVFERLLVRSTEIGHHFDHLLDVELGLTVVGSRNSRPHNHAESASSLEKKQKRTRMNDLPIQAQTGLRRTSERLNVEQVQNLHPQRV